MVLHSFSEDIHSFEGSGVPDPSRRSGVHVATFRHEAGEKAVCGRTDEAG